MMKTVKILIPLLSLLFSSSCREGNENEVYYRFPDQTWERFHILQLDLPLKEQQHPVKVTFFARYTRAFSYPSLNLHVIMKTPAGEERIKEFSMRIKDREGRFLHSFDGDSCEQSLVLNHELSVPRSGTLQIDLENLIPRMETEGLLGVGIRITK